MLVRHRKRDLLVELPYERCCSTFPGFNFPTGELPKAALVLIIRSTGNENILINNRHGDCNVYLFHDSTEWL
jgi:hypothetical protein